MRLLRSLFCSSIGRKQVVAVSGLLLIGFLLTHLAGNFLLLAGADKFDSYADMLAKNPAIIPAEIALALLFLVHIVWGLWVSVRNKLARPVEYENRANAGGRTIGSGTMKYTGLMTLVFLLAHVFTFKFQHPAGTSLWEWVVEWFQKPLYMGFYVLAMIFLGAHLSHGVQSAFQTLGLRHPAYTPIVEKAGLALAVVLAAGFGMLPLWGFLQGAG